MKKLIALLLSMVMLLGLAACGDDPAASNEGGMEAQGENNAPVADLNNAEPSPEKDFVVMALSDTTCELTEYVGNDEIVVFPETVEGMQITAISAYCFRNTTSVKSIRLSDSVEVIGTAAFSFNTNIETVVFGKGVKQLGDSAFMMAEGIREIVLNDGLESIGEYCFQSCTVEKLDIPGTVREFSPFAISGCDAKEIVLQEGITGLGSGTFFSCNQLTSLTLPSTLKDLGDDAFSLCSSLTSVTIPDGVTVLDGTFNGCKALTSVTIPQSVTTIGSSCFKDCAALETISLPQGLTTIGEDAFNGCKTLKTLEIPASVTEIGEEALSWTCDTIIAGADTAAARYALYNGIAFQDKDTGKTIGGDSGYQANLPSDIILSFNGKETSVIGKNSAEIMDTFGVSYEKQTNYDVAQYPQGVPYDVRYDTNEDGWTDIVLEEEFTDGQTAVYMDHITVSVMENISILGIPSDATKWVVFNILGDPHEHGGDYYYWYNVQIGDTQVEHISARGYSEDIDEISIYFHPPVTG